MFTSRETTVASTTKGIHADTVVRMVQNYVDRTYKLRESGEVTKVSHDRDAHCITFPLGDVIDFMRDNNIDPCNPGPEFGLRIYLGLHQHTKEEDNDMPDRPEHWMNQHTAILVCTKNGKDLLDPNPTFIGWGGMGLDEGQLCPPPACSPLDARLTP